MKFIHKENKKIMAQYSLVREYHEDEYGNSYTSYGIAVNGKEKLIYSDVTTDEHFGGKIVDTLNKNEVSPLHLELILEDILLDLSI
ncbi:MAG: DUF6514 family protein [Acutalibacteraceae bacterium]